jgi:MerR family transcriptional regulator/heat shock protein HspR
MNQDLENNNLPVYTIGVAANLIGVSVHALRMYESAGILSPKRSETKRRLYSKNDIIRLKCVRHFIEDDGLNIAGIKTVLSLIPCWKLKPCSEEDRGKCDAYHKMGEPCWIVKTRGDICTDVDCRDCEVYLNAANCTNIKELIKQVYE